MNTNIIHQLNWELVSNSNEATDEMKSFIEVNGKKIIEKLFEDEFSKFSPKHTIILDRLVIDFDASSVINWKTGLRESIRLLFIETLKKVLPSSDLGEEVIEMKGEELTAHIFKLYIATGNLPSWLKHKQFSFVKEFKNWTDANSSDENEAFLRDVLTKENAKKRLIHLLREEGILEFLGKTHQVELESLRTTLEFVEDKKDRVKFMKKLLDFLEEKKQWDEVEFLNKNENSSTEIKIKSPKNLSIETWFDWLETGLSLHSTVAKDGFQNVLKSNRKADKDRVFELLNSWEVILRLAIEYSLNQVIELMSWVFPSKGRIENSSIKKLHHLIELKEQQRIVGDAKRILNLFFIFSYKQSENYFDLLKRLLVQYQIINAEINGLDWKDESFFRSRILKENKKPEEEYLIEFLLHGIVPTHGLNDPFNEMKIGLIKLLHSNGENDRIEKLKKIIHNNQTIQRLITLLSSESIDLFLNKLFPDYYKKVYLKLLIADEGIVKQNWIFILKSITKEKESVKALENLFQVQLEWGKEIELKQKTNKVIAENNSIEDWFDWLETGVSSHKQTKEEGFIKLLKSIRIEHKKKTLELLNNWEVILKISTEYSLSQVIDLLNWVFPNRNQTEYSFIKDLHLLIQLKEQQKINSEPKEILNLLLIHSFKQAKNSFDLLKQLLLNFQEKVIKTKKFDWKNEALFRSEILKEKKKLIDEHLIRFLMNGTVPFHESNDSFPQLKSELIKQLNSNERSKKLKKTIYNDQAIQRLITLLSSETIDLFFQKLFPGFYEKVYLKLLNQKREIVKQDWKYVLKAVTKEVESIKMIEHLFQIQLEWGKEIENRKSEYDGFYYQLLHHQGNTSLSVLKEKVSKFRKELLRDWRKIEWNKKFINRLTNEGEFSILLELFREKHTLYAIEFESIWIRSNLNESQSKERIEFFCFVMNHLPFSSKEEFNNSCLDFLSITTRQLENELGISEDRVYKTWELQLIYYALYGKKWIQEGKEPKDDDWDRILSTKNPKIIELIKDGVKSEAFCKRITSGFNSKLVEKLLNILFPNQENHLLVEFWKTNKEAVKEKVELIPEKNLTEFSEFVEYLENENLEVEVSSIVKNTFYDLIKSSRNVVKKWWEKQLNSKGRKNLFKIFNHFFQPSDLKKEQLFHFLLEGKGFGKQLSIIQIRTFLEDEMENWQFEKLIKSKKARKRMTKDYDKELVLVVLKKQKPDLSLVKIDLIEEVNQFVSESNLFTNKKKLLEDFMDLLLEKASSEKDLNSIVNSFFQEIFSQQIPLDLFHEIDQKFSANSFLNKWGIQYNPKRIHEEANRDELFRELIVNNSNSISIEQNELKIIIDHEVYLEELKGLLKKENFREKWMNRLTGEGLIYFYEKLTGNTTAYRLSKELLSICYLLKLISFKKSSQLLLQEIPRQWLNRKMALSTVEILNRSILVIEHFSGKKKQLILDMISDLGTESLQKYPEIKQWIEQGKESSYQAPKWDYESKLPDQVYAVENAGIVLLHPFIARLLDACQFTKDRAFVSEEIQERACMLLHYLITGTTEAEEHQLALIKVMCGLSATKPIPITIEISEKEKIEVENLLKAVIQYWDALKNSSPDGLRAAFLIREGELSKRDEWELVVKKETRDLLIDRLPWGYGIVRYKWMEKTIHVNWTDS